MIKLYRVFFTLVQLESGGCSNKSKQEEKLIQTDQIPLAMHLSFSEDSESI